MSFLRTAFAAPSSADEYSRMAIATLLLVVGLTVIAMRRRVSLPQALLGAGLIGAGLIMVTHS